VYLSSLAGEADLTGQHGDDVDEALVQNMIANAKKSASSSSSQEVVELKLYCIEIVTRTEDGLADGNVERMVWNWSKPASLYLKKGSWCSTMDAAVVDGAWRAGMGFLVLVELVGEERTKRVVEKGSPWVLVPRDEGMFDGL
jgi:hypothetical protein